MIPNYLASFADQIIVKKNTTRFRIKCTCGCDTFLLAKSKNDEKELNNSFESYWKSFKLPIFSLKNAIDKHNGEKYIYGTTFFGIRLGKFYLKDLPKFDVRKIIKARCYQCKNEFIIFDSKQHGYNALAENEQQYNDCEITQKFIWTKNPNKIVIMIRNDLSYNEFSEEFGESMEKYSNAFDSIEIYTMINGHKKRFFEEETA